jgi:hypothetical protein
VSTRTASAPAAERSGAADAKAEPGGAEPAGRRGSLLALGSAIGNRRLGQALRIGAADDPAEREAERAADRVAAAPPRASTAGRAAAASPSTAPAVVHQVLRGAGEPLRADVRALMETRLGGDFGGVRVHTGPDAAASAHAVGARAYAVGPRLVFGARQYAPSTPAGRRLIAHELAHAAQGDAGVLRRDTYETRGTLWTPAAMQGLMDQGYWVARTMETFQLIRDPRMAADPEEQDAVLAAVWALPPPARVTSVTTRLVPVAPRALPAPPAAPGGPAPAPVPAGGPAPAPAPAPAAPAPGAAVPAAPASAPALLYQVTFRPGRGRAKPTLELRHVASGAGTVPVAAAAAPAAYRPTQPGLNHGGFPGNDFTAYMRGHPDEHRALFQWLENTAPAAFDQVVTTETWSTGRTPRVTHRSVFHAAGTRVGTGAGAAFPALTIRLASQGTVDPVQTVQASYRDRSTGDWHVEHQQAASRRPASRLGTVNGMQAVPAAERSAVGIAVANYFSRSGIAVRNAEVDARIPIGTSGTVALYTFVFGAANDVTVTRIGTAGTGPGQVDTARLSVERVRGFPGATAQPAALRAWWAARYPRGGALSPAPAPAPQGQQAIAAASAALVTEMNGLIAAGVASRAWFNDNWGIEVLDAAGTRDRLRNVHRAPARLVADAVDLSATDLVMLELALQTLSDSELARLSGVRVGRKTASITLRGRRVVPGGRNQYGVTLMDRPRRGSPSTTVLYFGSLYGNDESLFTGGTAANALPAVTMNLLHELGHASGYQGGLEAAFTAWRTRNRPPNPTWYAASGASELFPEAFALYHTDPRWLCSSAPLLYAWFDELVRTGTPPAAAARLNAPARCP